MAGFLHIVAENLLGKITEAASQSETTPIRSQLRKLEITVSTLKFVLADAEEKQVNEPQLISLLKQLRASFSDAEELIDELECEYLKRRLQNRRGDGQKVRCISSSSNFVDFIPRIDQIRETLDDFDATMSNFNLVEKDDVRVKRLKGEMTLHTSISGSDVFARLLRSKRQAILSDNYDSIIGREEVTKSIIDKLLMQGDDTERFSILAIYGIRGMGKTSVAKLVYNDDSVYTYFDKRIWVCASDDFEIHRIKREILSCATGELASDALTERQLRNRLQRNLNGRKFLLVLDDVGTLNSSRESELKEILQMGSNGSRIIVTTHNEPILYDMSVVHKVEKLDQQNSLKLFESESKCLTENTHKVAEEIVAKCEGGPLAIKCMARLLSSKSNDASEWVNVKDVSERWKPEEIKNTDGVLQVLKLSFDLMPSFLKPCFLCFSLLPKDYVFYSYELIQLWMAQGILQSGDNDLELVGDQYFNELWSRGFLEDVEEHALGYWFKIHSLVHDLAIQKAQENPEGLHHLSFVDNSNKGSPPSTSRKVRCLTASAGGVEPKINGVSVIKCMSKFKQLRILNLCSTSLEAIPTSIDTLKHLRYFDLRGSRRIKRLPESICNLRSLQTLILAFCSELEELPKNIKNMINLRLLWITTKQACLEENGIGSLKSLRFLAIGGCENLTQLFEDIEKLNALRTLIIYDCKSLLTVPEGLKTLSGLRNMAISGCEQLKFTFGISMLSGLNKLLLKGFPASNWLPRWIYGVVDMDLNVLEIGDFPKLRTLPDRRALSVSWSKLRILRISNCPRLTELPPCDVLKELRITFCGSLSKQCMDPNNHHKLEISHIPYIYVDSRRLEGNTKTQVQPATSVIGQTESEGVNLEGS